MKKHIKKIIAPIIITSILILYLLGYLIASIFVLGEFILFPGIFLAVISIGGIILSVHTLIERINEIRNGEEDDLSKY